MDQFSQAAFWVALGKIIWVNILLSGDNAVVIALAARSLPEHQRKKAVFGGSDLAAIAITTALSPERRMLATMIAPRAPHTAPDVSASMACAATETR